METMEQTEAGRKERVRVVNEIINKNLEAMENLYMRWQEEKQYEDFKDYIKEFKKIFGDMYVKASKRPFGVILNIKDFPYKIQFNIISRGYEWRQVREI